MDKRIVADAKQSREILKAIRYGLALRPESIFEGEAAESVRGRLVELKRAYLEKRKLINEKASGFGNVIFYKILQERYSSFDYRLDKNGLPQSNIYEFKVDGRPPSLLTMLVNKDLGRVTEPEKRYGKNARYVPFFESIEQLFREAGLVYPDAPTFDAFIDTLIRGRSSGTGVALVAAICPDYSHTKIDGAVRYTFESLGEQPGLAGDKLIGMMPAIGKFLNTAGVRFSVNLFGGDFESLAFQEGTSSLKIAKALFIERVKQQISNISHALDTPVEQSLFFEKTGGEADWIKRHEAIVADLECGNYGRTGLQECDIDDIFASRLPLYQTWFDTSDSANLKVIFLRQAAEYALMGEIYSDYFNNVVVLGVDHYKMAPFYSFHKQAAVIYKKTDYIPEPLELRGELAHSEGSSLSEHR